MSADIRPLGRTQKAAAVLLSVGNERASNVLSYLNEDEVEQLAVEITQLGEIDPDQLDVILHEFHTEAVAHQHLLSGGERHARDLLRTIHGDEADDIVDRLLASTTSAPFHFLRMHEPAEVLQHLRDEHPQTIALVLSHLTPRLAASLLAGLDPDIQPDVAGRLATLEAADPDVVQRVEASLRSRLGEVRRRSGRRDGVKELADLLNQVDRTTERAILGRLEAEDPDLAERVRALMFVFEDLVTLDDRALQEVLRTVDVGRLAIALKGVTTELRGALERNLSQRARTTLAEEIDLLGQVRVRDVEEAQSEIVQTVHELEREGQIVLSRGQEEFVA